nr:DUF5696 domain-containing protein [uncultured Acetatifactor sp.]
MGKFERKWMGLLGLAAGTLLALPLSAQAAGAPEGMKEVAGNGQLTLYLNEEDASVAVMDNETGRLWYTNPADADSDEKATAYYKRLLKSQLQVQYYNENVQSALMDSYNDSVANGQFEIELLEDGLAVTYTMGKLTESLLLPNAISEERFLKFTEQMDSSAKRKIDRNYVLVDVVGGLTTTTESYPETYPGYGETNFYVLRGGVKDYLKEELAGYLEEAGYTQEDFEQDQMESGAGDADSTDPWFTIPLTYRLDGDNLVVSIDPEAVAYNEDGFYLVDIDMLPYFGAVDEGDGYIFVPDGSGSLIYLNNGKTTAPSYYAMVYGQDESRRVLSKTQSEVEPSLTVKLPVFGLKADDQAFFAIIEDGAGNADISADIGGRLTSYNNVYAGFSYLQYGPAALSDMVGANSYQLYSQKDFTGIFQVRYSFLTGEEADYSGMAACYRTYLEEQGALSRKAESEELPLYTEYIGAIDRYETFLGVKYKAVEPLTTFAQAEDIAGQLADLGVKNQKMVYTGWMNGGLHGTAATKVKVVGKLEKGGVSVKKLQKDMAAMGVDTFMTVDMQYVYQDKLLDGYSAMQYGAGYFDHSDITVNSYLFADGSMDKKLANLISPYYVGKVTDAVTKAASRYQLNGINLGTASWFLYSDYLENRYTDRQKASMLYEESFAAIQETVQKTLGDNGNAYSFPYVDYMINVPLSSNGYQILDADIPFYQMVLHGYISYAGEAINMADDYRTTLLKSVEGGAGLHYQWIYGDNSLVKETDYDNLYSVHYGSWIDTAAEDYRSVAEVLDGLENQLIVKHEIVSDKLTKTVYEDGSTVYVNFGESPVQCEGVEIAARGFAVRKGSD